MYNLRAKHANLQYTPQSSNVQMKQEWLKWEPMNGKRLKTAEMGNN